MNVFIAFILISLLSLSISLNTDIYYISSDEGLLTHYQQLDFIHTAAYSVDRRVQIVGFYSYHYPDVKIVHLCDIFDLPEEVQCTHKSMDTVIAEYKCVYVGAYIHPLKHYKYLPQSLETVNSFNYSDIQCMVGPVTIHTGNRESL